MTDYDLDAIAAHADELVDLGVVLNPRYRPEDDPFYKPERETDDDG